MNCKTLFVIGNGFDLYHGVPSRYVDFHQWLIVNKNWNRFKSIEQHFKGVDLWSDLEENLGKFDSEGCCSDWSVVAPCAVLVNGRHFVCSARMVDSDFEDDLREWREEMLRGLSEWVLTLKPNNECPLLPIGSADALYLNFNYTKTLEDFYGIGAFSILHVHGVAGLPWRCLQLGHGTEIEVSKDREDELSLEIVDADSTAPIEELRHHVREWRKPVREIIKRHADFWERLQDVAKIVLLGCSVGSVDVPYIEKIAQVVRKDAVWHCSWYRDGEDEKSVESCPRLGCGTLILLS